MKYQILSTRKNPITPALGYDVIFEQEVPEGLSKNLGFRLMMENAVDVYDFSFADLSNGNLSGLRLSDKMFNNADFTGANLSRTEFYSSLLIGANFLRANLIDSSLRRAHMTGANLEDADLTRADLYNTDLTNANLTNVTLTGANLKGANLSGVDLRTADLKAIKSDFFDVLLRAPQEIGGLREALVRGVVDGSTYAGECACLVGSIANLQGTSIHSLQNGLAPDATRPAEKWFLAIGKGDTPETNQVSAITVEWIDEFVSLMTEHTYAQLRKVKLMTSKI